MCKYIGVQWQSAWSFLELPLICLSQSLWYPTSMHETAILHCLQCPVPCYGSIVSKIGAYPPYRDNPCQSSTRRHSERLSVARARDTCQVLVGCCHLHWFFILLWSVICNIQNGSVIIWYFISSWLCHINNIAKSSASRGNQDSFMGLLEACCFNCYSWTSPVLLHVSYFYAVLSVPRLGLPKNVPW